MWTCQRFKPEWAKLKQNMQKIKHKGVEIKMEDYEHSTLEPLGGGKINGKSIDGYPTIKIKLISGNEQKEYDFSDYGKERNATYMYNFIKNLCDGLSKYKNKN